MINNRTRAKALKWFKKEGVELIHINSQFAGIIGSQVAQKLNIPYVYHMREYLDKDFFVRFYSDKLVKKYIAAATKVIGISQSIQQYYQQKLGRSVDLIYNGIPVSEENYYDGGDRLEKDTLELAILGRVNPAKGQAEAIEAVELLKDEKVRLHIIGFTGKDDYERKLKEYATERALPVVFHEFTNKPAEILKTCDVGLTCSVAEAFGRVTVENMLAGLFVIGANTGGTPEIILDGETGLLYQQGSKEDLAEKIRWVLANKTAAKQMLQKGQSRGLEVFTIQATANRVMKLYEEVLKQ